MVNRVLYQELVSSGQIKLLDPNAAPISPASQGVPNDRAVMPTSPQSEAPCSTGRT